MHACMHARAHGHMPLPPEPRHHYPPTQAILDRILEGSHAGSGAPRQPWAPHMLEGGVGPTPHNLYCLGALEGLIERAAAYSRAGQPVKWGWCR